MSWGFVCLVVWGIIEPREYEQRARTMNASDADRQIKQMVNFILQEAQEKANEIRIKVKKGRMLVSIIVSIIVSIVVVSTCKFCVRGWKAVVVVIDTRGSSANNHLRTLCMWHLRRDDHLLDRARLQLGKADASA